MGYKLTIDADSLDSEINNLILAKVKGLMRTDKELAGMISETIEREVSKKINIAFIGFDMEVQVKKVVEKSLPREGWVGSQFSMRIKERTHELMKPIEERIAARIKEMPESEVENLIETAINNAAAQNIDIFNRI